MVEFVFIVLTYTVGLAVLGLVGMAVIAAVLAPVLFMKWHLMRSRFEPRKEHNPNSTQEH